MSRKFLVAWVALFVLWMAGSFVVHGLLLGADYDRLQTIFRSPQDSQKYYPFMLLAHVILAGAFAWIYERGREPKPWLVQGVRFGLAVTALTVLPNYMIYYVVQPMPAAVVIKQILFSGILLVLLGVAAAWLLREGS